jgi:hypothetical protein
MPFTEDMIWRAAKQATDYVLEEGKVRKSAVSLTDNTTGMPHVGNSNRQRFFVVGPEGAMQDVEMLKCEHCEMWYAAGHVCACKWLPESSLKEEPVYEAELVVPKEKPLEYPFTCKNCGFQQLGPEHVCRVENRHR